MPDRIPTFEDSIMPRATIKAFAKTVLGTETSIQKEALTALAKGSSVFISYLTTHANEIAMSKKRKTIMPSDVLEALKVIEFDRFVPDLRETHERTEAETKAKKNRKKSEALDGVEAVDGVEATDDVDASLPANKKARRSDDRGPDQIDADREEVLNTGEAAGPPEDDEEDDEDEEEEEEEDEDEDEEEEEEEDGPEGQAEGKNGGDLDPTAEVDTLDEEQSRQRDDYDEALDDGDDSD